MKNIVYHFIFIIILTCCTSKSSNYNNNNVKQKSKSNENENIIIKEFDTGKIIVSNFDNNIYLYKEVSGKKFLLDSIINDEELEVTLADFNFFKFDDKFFFYAQYVFPGTSEETNVFIYYINPNNLSIKQVGLHYASEYYRKLLGEGKGIWKGEYINFKDNNISSMFSIYNSEDANCCPTGGRVEAFYKLTLIGNDSMFFEQDTCIYYNE